MSKPIVLITGSSGFIGASVIPRLAEQYEIIGFDRPGLPHPPAPAHCVDVDISNEESVKRGLKEANRIGGDRLCSPQGGTRSEKGGTSGA